MESEIDLDGLEPDYVMAARKLASEFVDKLCVCADALHDENGWGIPKASFRILLTAAIHQQMVERLDRANGHEPGNPLSITVGLRAYVMMFGVDCDIDESVFLHDVEGSA